MIRLEKRLELYLIRVS